MSTDGAFTWAVDKRNWYRGGDSGVHGLAERVTARLGEAMWGSLGWTVECEAHRMANGQTMMAVEVRKGATVILRWNNLDSGGQVLPVGGSGSRWPDVCPRPDVPAGSVEAWIRSAAWRAGESHRGAAYDRYAVFGDADGMARHRVWDGGDWDAASAEYARLQTHPAVGVGYCGICGHYGQDCTGDGSGSGSGITGGGDSIDQ